MKKLKIEAYDKDNVLLFRTIAHRIDSTRRMTIISTSETHFSSEERESEKNNIRFISKVDHFNIIAGMVTIYYENGSFLEITRFYD